MHRAHVKHGATAVGVHLPERGAGHQEGAIQVHVDDFAPVGERQLMHRINVLDAGVGDGDIQTTPVFHNGGNAIIHRLFIGDIHGQGHGGAASGFNGHYGVAGAVEGQVCHSDFGAFAAVCFCDGPADAPAGTGNQCNAVFKTHGDFLLNRMPRRATR